MRMTRIYYSGIVNENQQIQLPVETSHYVTKVLRLKKGAPLVIFNGDGKDYNAQLLEQEKKTVILKINDSHSKNNESPLKIQLAQGLLRSEKMDFVIQKAVELGVTTLTPIITDFCNLKLTAERSERRLAHWRQIAISACEQSGRAVLPTIEPVIRLHEWLKQLRTPTRLLFEPHSLTSLSRQSRATDVVVLVGPEGGLAPQEVALAIEHKFIALTLGPRILRTETAALAALTTLQYAWGDFN